MNKFLRAFLVGMVAICAIFGNFQSKVMAQEANNAICILGEPDVSKFPDVTLTFRATDSTHRTIRNLTQNGVSIQENDQKYTPNRLSFDPKGTGLDLYFIIDTGVSGSIATAKAMITRFLDTAGVDGVDRITIMTTGNNVVVGKPSTDFQAIKADLSALSNNRSTFPTPILSTVSSALNRIRGEESRCGRASAIMILGAEITYSDYTTEDSVTQTAIALNTPIFVMHDVHHRANSAPIYRRITQATSGVYFATQATLNTGSSDLDDVIFKQLSNMRGSYALTYRSTSGVSGKRDLALTFANTSATSETQRSSYNVTLQSPRITLISPVEGSDVLRTATVYTDPKFLYDKDVVPIEFKIEWPDGHDRVPSKIRIIGTTSTGDQTIQEINESEFSRNNYTLSWNVDPITTEGTNPFGIRIEVTDELGLQTITSPSNFTVTNLVPESVAKQTTQEINKNLKITQYLVYLLAGIIAASIALIVIFRKKIKQAFSATGKIGMAIENVRKTIVGGTGRRKNPIARLEVVRPTVEVKSIFTESVKLGRDPNVSDYTFYSMNSDCSVSGEHAQLIKKRDGWKIIAVSHSGSPVFIDEQRIEMHQEIPLKTGQLIELGYQDLGSALFRFVEVESSEVFDFAHDTEFKPDTKIQTDDGYRRTQVNLPAGDDLGMGDAGQGSDQYSSQDFFAGTSTDDDDFDALFNNLREN